MKRSPSLIVAVGAAVLAPAFWIAALAQAQPSKKVRLTPIRLLDAGGRPVAGAAVADFFWRMNDQESDFKPTDTARSQVSDANGEIALVLEVPGHLDATCVYAIRPDKDRPLVGVRTVAPEDVGKPITITMYPACRVRFQIESTGLAALEKTHNAKLTGPGWWRAAYLYLGRDVRAPRPLFTSSTTGKLEFLLPPGRYRLFAYGTFSKVVERLFVVKPGEKELLLGTIDVPAEEVDPRHFPKSSPRRHLTLHGDTGDARHVAYSPVGNRLATAHPYAAGPGAVKLWDATTGAHVATLPVADKSVVALAFSPAGKLLAGKTVALAGPRRAGEIILWDVASRRAVRTFPGHADQVSTLAFSPDGKTLAFTGEDETTRFCDVAAGRETGRIAKPGVVGQPAAFAPDGRTLALRAESTITLWDLSANRPRATFERENERTAFHAVAYAPDGRTLAVAGSMFDPKDESRKAKAQVWLYDLANEPVRRRAVLTVDHDGRGRSGLLAPSLCSDVAFTPDGRRVVAVAVPTVMIWDVATGTEQTAFEHVPGGTFDRIAISPDGRWLAITQPVGAVSITELAPE